MAGFASFDDFISKLTVDDQHLFALFYKISTAPEAANVMHSLWRVGNVPAAGGDGAAGSGTPGSGGTALDLADGSLAKWADQSPKRKYLTTLSAQSSGDITLLLFDRLVSVSGISLVGTGSKGVGSAALPRYSGAASVGVEAYLEVTTATATTAPIVSMNSYTDQDGNTGAAGGTISFPAQATNVDALIGPLPLAAGDTGVRSVETINVDTAGTAGACNLILVRRLAALPLRAIVGNTFDFLTLIPKLERLYDGHTFMLAVQPPNTAVVKLRGNLKAAYG